MATTRRAIPALLVVAAGVTSAVVWSAGTRDEPPQPPAETVVSRSSIPNGHYVQMVAPDAIEPVYDPAFVDAAAVDWSDDALVIGVEIGGDSRAYPLSHLHQREIVIDRVGDVPIAVSY
ncbi:MAG: DUF3179 domain-containing protein [bacterium]|nr:DUF3179 domain-containing protein [bacterium]